MYVPMMKAEETFCTPKMFDWGAWELHGSKPDERRIKRTIW